MNLTMTYSDKANYTKTTNVLYKSQKNCFKSLNSFHTGTYGSQCCSKESLTTEKIHFVVLNSSWESMNMTFDLRTCVIALGSIAQAENFVGAKFCQI